MTPRKETKKIIVHCSDTASGTVEAIRRFHTTPQPNGRGWEDIGYHYVITQDGIIGVGRPEEMIGAHCEKENHDSVGVCLVGIKEFNDLQMASLKNLVVSLLNKYGLLPENVSAHYEWPSAVAQGKTCPNIKGDDLRTLIQGAVD